MPPDWRPTTVLIVAGEPSGDQAASHVVAALRRARPSWRLLAVGGDLMRAAGAEIVFPTSDIAVMGFTEVLRHLPRLRRRMKRLQRLLAEGAVDLLLPVDSPGFNLRLASTARAAGVPVLYFIAPQVWAWHKSRVEAMRRDIDRLAVILPFETAWFASERIDARFVGHPIMEREAPTPAPADDDILALMPGSRAQEVERLLPVFLGAAAALTRERPLRCEVLASPLLPDRLYDELCAAAPFPVAIRRSGIAPFLSDKRAALVASGTATLETAVAGAPMVVAYRTGALNFWLARRLVKLDNIALVNLVAGREVVPECIQDDAAPDILARRLAPLLADGADRRAQLDAFAEVRRSLGGPGCGERVAEMALELLENAS